MRFGVFSLLGLAAGLTTALETFERNVIFEPPSDANWTDPRVLYARTVQLEDGRLLATWENYSPEPPLVHYPIVESLDGGLTWEEVGQVHDQENGWGMRYQPFLYELRQKIGEFEAGTILCAGNSIPTDLSRTKIDVYASTDKGRTWNFVSSVVEGGVALPNNEETPVWEPEILVYEDTLILYFADQRDEPTGQSLSHKETKDLVNWSETVSDVAYPDDYYKRPGMPVVAQLPTGDYIYVYEYGGTTITPTYRFPIYYRIAADPRRFADAPEFYINATNTDILPNNSPYVVWSPIGGEHGSIIVSSNLKYVYINRELGDPDAWVAYDVPEEGAYTRSLRVMEEDPDFLLIVGAGVLPPSKTNKVTASMVRISELLRKPVGGCKRRSSVQI